LKLVMSSDAFSMEQVKQAYGWYRRYIESLETPEFREKLKTGWQTYTMIPEIVAWKLP
jgi:hypothetical protein